MADEYFYRPFVISKMPFAGFSTPAEDEEPCIHPQATYSIYQTHRNIERYPAFWHMLVTA